jgi:hypothetical protein
MSGDKHCSCQDQNPANLAELDPSAGPEPRIAEVEVCDSRSCETGHLLVRGDRVSFVSVEQTKRLGEKKLDPVAMPSDIRIPPSYVLVNDATGRILDKCDIYVVKWRNKNGRSRAEIDSADRAAAEEYFRTGAQIRSGFVELPRGPWRRVGRIRFIRYERHGFDRPFEHRYDMPVELLYSPRPLAWRLPLPEGCVIDSRGFVRP